MCKANLSSHRNCKKIRGKIISYKNTNNTLNNWMCCKWSGEASMTDIGITGGGKGSNMLYLSGVQTKKILTEEIINKVVEEVKKVFNRE